MTVIIAELPSDSIFMREHNQSMKKPLIRSMACLMGSAEFKERPLKNSVIRDRWLNGHVIQANNHGSH